MPDDYYFFAYYSGPRETPFFKSFFLPEPTEYSTLFPYQYLLPYRIFKSFLFYIFYFLLRWVFIAAHGLSLVAVSGGYSSLKCVGFPLRWLLLLRSAGSRHAGFSSCGTQALEQAGFSSCGVWAQ